MAEHRSATLAELLLNPAAYPEHPDSVDFAQTHISYVFVAGSSVYKVKKPVDFGFLDFSTPERRHVACLDEVRLNRRLSPDVYLGVVPVTEAKAGLVVGGSGDPVDWAVHMRRLPAGRMLEQLISNDAVPRGTASRLGEIVGRFHLAADRGERISTIGGQQTIAQNWEENFKQAQAFRGRTIDAVDDDRIRAYVRAFLHHERLLLTARDDGGYIRDVHGDLRCGQIWVLEASPPAPGSLAEDERELLARLGGVRILDCLEFSEQLRFCDTASDIAFLAMDLEFRGAASLARELLSRYLEVTSDERLPLLLNFYSCYRAYVRGKVDSLAVTEREIPADERQRLAEQAGRFFRLAARYAERRSRAHLVVMIGRSGSGKSYLARALAIEIGAALFSSDVTRKRLLGLPLNQPATQAAYTRHQTGRTYDAMLEAADAELRQNHSVVLDATFLSSSQRALPLRLANRLGVPITYIWCEAGQAVLDSRLREREADPYRVSDANAAISAGQARYEQPPVELPHDAVVRVDTSEALDFLLPRLRHRLS